MIKVSAPGKIHLLGEHATPFGNPSILAALDLRIYVTISKEKPTTHPLKKIIEPIVKKHLKLKSIPSYNLTISSEIPLGAGLGSSAAISAAYIGALLLFLKVRWNLNLINKLTFQAEKIFHGKPSGGDNSTVVFGGFVWFRKETDDFKIIQQLDFTIPPKLTKKIVLINTGTPKESTKEMVAEKRLLYKKKPKLMEKFLKDQEQLVRELLPVLKEGSQKEFIRIIREGERNLEAIGVVSSYVKSIIRKIEESGGAAKICGAGGKTKATGVLLCYHQNRKILENISKSYNLPYFQAKLGVEGIRIEAIRKES